MEMARGTFAFPLLVRGAWPPDKPSWVRNKLQLYFQKTKVSGGGECEVRWGDSSPRQAEVWFSSDEVRNCVLNKTHELELKNIGTVQLDVTPLDKNAAEAKNGTVADPAEPESEMAAASKTKPKEEKGATALHDIKSDGPPHSSAVALKNLPENISLDILILLVESCSRLSAEEGDFTLEILSDIDAAVVTFKKTIDVLEFIAKCSGRTLNEKKIVAVQLEITKSILVENLSPTVTDELLKLYFEKPIHGGAVVIDIVVEDSSAIISFQNAKDLDSILEIDHVIDKKPILVYPYYKSLPSALYGNKGPVVKMPDAFPMTINPHILQFFRDKMRTGEINDKMAKCYCDVVWPDLGKPNIIKLSPSFSKDVKGLTKLTKNWKKEALDTITSMLLKYTFAENHVNLLVWKVIQPEIDQLLNQNVSVVLDMSIGKMILVGESNSVNELKHQVRNIIQIAFTKQKRENESISETLDLSPAMYTFLQHNYLQEKLSKQFTDLWMNYDAATGSITLCGLPTEVFGGKSYILEKLFHLKKKQIEIDHSLIRFLQKVKTNESCLQMFTSLGINAVHEIKDDGLELFAKENNTLSAAERSLKEILTTKEIVVDNRHLLGKKEWKPLLRELDKKLNYSQKSVEIEEVSLGTEVKIIIFGFADAVIQVFEHLNDFVNRNAFIQKFIEVESSAVLEFLVNIRQITSLPLTEKKDVKIEVHEDTNQMNIKLSGPQEHVCDIEDLIRKEISSLSFSVLNLTEPGIKMYFKEEKDFVSATVKQKFHCLIKSQERPFLKSDNKDSSQLCYQVQLPEGPLVTVLRGDLCVHHVDVIVNASNESLHHIGGLAAELLKAAGPILQTTCNRIIKTQGILKPGDAVITDAGNLLCSHVIHAVGPRWESHTKEMSVKHLKRAVKESLKLAEQHNLGSIAIPALSSGIFGFPLNLCAETIVQSIKEFWKDSKGRLSLQKIDLLNNDMKTVKAISDAVQSEFGVYIKSPSIGQGEKQLKVPETGNVKQLGNQEKAISKKVPQIQIITSCIQNMKTDVIVSSVGADLCLQKGVISSAIYKEAGPMLQQLLFKEANANISDGDIFVTKSCNLCCDRVFHAIVPKWDQGTGNAGEILKSIISRCLQNAEALQLKSISFPAIGTGLLGFPKRNVAGIMFEETSKFISVYDPKFLQDIYFVLHPSDKQTIEAFCTVFNYPAPKQMLTSARIEKKSTGQVFGRISSPKPYSAEMKVGEVLLQFVVGDITVENTDVIVNSTASFHTLHKGLSGVILDVAGFTVESELISKGNRQEMIITKGGSLPCQHIVHLFGQEEPEKIKSFVVKILRTCERNKITSIAFPALGTGFAEAIIQGMTEFVNEDQVIFLSRIRIVTRYPKMFDDFRKIMEKREGTRLSESESIFTKTKNLLTSVIWGSKSKEDKRKEELIILADLIEPAIIHICGESIQEVENAKSWLKKLALNQLDDQVITNDLLYGFGKREHEELKCLQKQLQIKIEFEYKQSVVEIRICGLKRNVSSASFKIHQMMEDVRKTQERINNEDLIRHMVQWEINDGNQFLPIDNATNFILENAFTKKDDFVMVEIQSNQIFVDFKKNIAEGMKNRKYAVKRVLLAEGEGENIPNHWEDMNGVQFKEVELMNTSQEYLDVMTSLTKTFPIPRNTVKIKRIQNPTLWKNYLLEKKTISEKNAAGIENERILFHEPSSQSLKYISSRGFDRNFSHLGEYGKGSYFYKEPVSAFRDTYSRFQPLPGKVQLKHMFRARVITGNFCQGRQSMIIPPGKNALHPEDLYDSVVDHLQKPSLFVIFKDIQAYPEYLIEYY